MSSQELAHKNLTPATARFGFSGYKDRIRNPPTMSVYKHLWAPYCTCKSVKDENCMECLYAAATCDHPEADVCTCRFCLRRFVALEVARALHAGDAKPLKDWIADWTTAELSAETKAELSAEGLRRRVCRFPGHTCGSLSSGYTNPDAAQSAQHAVREISSVAQEAWQMLKTPESYEIYKTAAKRATAPSHAYFNWQMGRCLTDNTMCSGKPDSACCRGCLRHAAAVFPAFKEAGQDRQTAWATAWFSEHPDATKSMQSDMSGIWEEKVARIAAATILNPEVSDMIRAAVTINFN